MAGFEGMDIDQVRTLAARMDTAADTIHTTMGQLTTAFDSTHWVGPDREQFSSQWHGAHCQELTHVVTCLKDAASVARVNADQQEQASAH